MLPVVALLFSGCVTKQLWQQDAFREPWPQPHLQLAFNRDRKDVLVGYDELNDRSDERRPRAYFLFENERRIEAKHKPTFVNPTLMATLPAVPVFASNAPQTEAANQEFYAVATTNSTSFKLFSKDKELGEFYLPAYKDGVWLTQKALLMPLAVGADATIVGGVIGVMFWPNGLTVKP